MAEQTSRGRVGVRTELGDGRIFVAYWFCAKDQDEPIEEDRFARIAGTFLRLE